MYNDAPTVGVLWFFDNKIQRINYTDKNFLVGTAREWQITFVVHSQDWPLETMLQNFSCFNDSSVGRSWMCIRAGQIKNLLYLKQMKWVHRFWQKTVLQYWYQCRLVHVGNLHAG